jgi:hypothetical protein
VGKGLVTRFARVAEADRAKAADGMSGGVEDSLQAVVRIARRSGRRGMELCRVVRRRCAKVEAPLASCQPRHDQSCVFADEES